MNIGSRTLLVGGTIGAGCCGIPSLLKQANYQNTSSPSTVTLASPAEAESTSDPAPDLAEATALTQQNSAETSTQEPTIVVPEEVVPPAPQPPVKRNEENCLIVSRVDGLETLLYNTFELNSEVLVDLSKFVKVECTKTISEEDSKMPSNWDGLFPKALFENIGEVEVDKKIEIKTLTSEDSTKYKTTFSGSHFQKDIIGEWNKSELNIEDQVVTSIKIISSAPTSDKIYLMFKK